VIDPRVTSDLPGQICGSVDSDVFGEQDREKLIPWGSRVCGVYRAQIRKGQTRVFVVWNRLVRPDGVALSIDSPGVDQLGTAGMGGRVDNHFLEIFGNALMISIIGAGASNWGVSSYDRSNSASVYRENAQGAFADTAGTILEQYANIPPTIITDHGSVAKIYVQRDLDFSALFVSENDKGGDGSYFED
jgi:type IV secretion system protein VirB10